MKILIGIALLVLLSACKNNESNSVINLSENPSDQSNELIDLSSSEPVVGLPIEAPKYKVEVKWEHPGTRQDGSKLDASDIAEFIIHYGQDADNLDMKVIVTDYVNLSQVIELPKNGRWYISMSTVDGEGLESELSGVEGIDVCENFICNSEHIPAS